MSVSETLQKVQFSKSIAGYAQKEVDALLAALLPEVTELEGRLAGKEAELAAWQARADEIAETRESAETLVQNAKREAAALIAEANRTAEILLSDAKERAAATEAAAKKNAEKILATADGRGREILRIAKERSAAEAEKSAKIVKELAVYTARARALMQTAGDTLDALEATAPRIETVKKTEQAEPPASTPTSAPTSGKAGSQEKQPAEAHDFRFAGGRPIGVTPKETKRKLYDTVNVTYDTPDDGDGFADVKKLMDSRKEKKNPTGFAE